jgi:hypothetical protein
VEATQHQPDMRYGRPWRDKRGWRDERQRRRQMGGEGVSIGDATTSQARGMGGYGAKRGDGGMRGRNASRLEATASVEVMQ